MSETKSTLTDSMSAIADTKPLYKGYKTTIGIEVHAELKTSTKMFCNSKNDPHAQEPNTHVCPVCLAHPGTLPVVNKRAVEHVLKVGVAVGGELADYTEFDRKNYFYPDIPKGYQISQYLYPLVKGGTLAGVALTRVHLEEDTARSQHDQGEGSLIDYNRAGVPLMELVTEPVIHDAKTAGNFARELQLLLRTIGASSANMEKGEMRVEANISVSKTDTFGTKVEVKNLNSFKSVELAIEYEVKRQVELIEEGGKVVQETRGWDESKLKTYSQRVKESAHDYRYFPDPDIPKFKLKLDEGYSPSRIAESMPALPEKKRSLYSSLGLSREQIETIISSDILDTFFAKVLDSDLDRSVLPIAANYLTTDVSAYLVTERKLDIEKALPRFIQLIAMIGSKRINSRVAKDILAEVIFDGKDPSMLVEERGLAQKTSTTELLSIVNMVIASNPTVVADYKGGKTNSLQYLIGQGMKESKGSANPEMLRTLFAETIEGK